MASGTYSEEFSDSQRKPKRRWRTADLALVTALAAIDGADMQLLPATFRAMEVDLGLAPSGLSAMAAAQGISMALASPIWGSLADAGVSKRLLLAGGCFMWGLVTLALALVSHFWMMVFLRCLNGMALAMLTPVVQALVADEASPRDRGYYFGVIEFANRLLGQGVAMVVVTGLSNTRIHGLEGWRLGFIVVALLSVLMAMIVFLYLEEKEQVWRPERFGAVVELRSLAGYLRISTFQVVLMQGLVGTIPWQALNFTVMYFQYVGMSDFAAGTAFAMVAVGAGFGAILGGLLGDRLARWSPRHGRPLTAQVSVALGIPMVLLILEAVPRSPSSFREQVVMCFVLGLVCSWCKTGCNQPIFSEIVDPEKRASAMAWAYGLEGLSGALIGPLSVGFLSELVFGYRLSREQVTAMDDASRLANAAALARSLSWCAAVPWTLCFLLYTFLHFSYWQDVAEGSVVRSREELDEKHASVVGATEQTRLLPSD